MLDLDVKPERSVGNEQWEFVLGMPICQAVQILQKHCRVIKSVEVVYNDKHPLDSDLVLNLISDGIKLSFDSVSQRLKIIEVYNMSKVMLKYCGLHFSSKQIQPTYQQIDQSFGATHPGQFDPSLQLFLLNFRGITFFFPIEPKDEAHFNNGAYQQSSTVLPRGFTSTVPVSKMCVYTGSQLKDTKAPPMPTSCFYGNVNLEQAEVVIKNGECVSIKFKLLMEAQEHVIGNTSIEATEREIFFGNSAQLVLSELGSPCKIFYKSQDKMRIHSSNPKKLAEARNTDYFFNYFTLGLDILFDGSHHRVTKFILHSNFPGHYNFNIYYKCQFKISLPNREHASITVTPNTRWDEITQCLDLNVGKPVLLNRASSTNNTNPFGSTKCFGINNIIFEVMQNNYIASVTLYKPVYNI